MCSAISVAPVDLALAKEFVRRLAQEINPQLFTVTLFGSRAPGDTDEESDLNLFVTRREDAPQGESREAASHLACALTLKSGVLVSILVAAKEFLKQHEGFSFLQAVAEEGVEV